MAPSRRFVDHPGTKEAANTDYVVQEDKNPVMRGASLAVGASIVSSMPFLQRFLYGNAGFSKITNIPGLEKEVWRFDPTVIPLASSDALPSPPELGPELSQPQPADRVGRWLSIADYHQLYKSGEVTPLQLVEALLPIINREEKNPTEYSRAWLDIHVDEVRAAARASTERWAQGKQLGILDGVPFGVKSDCEVKGYVNTMGMAVRKDYAYFNTVCEESLWPVIKLEEQGAVMVGKMNQHEIGMDTTGCNPATGTAINWCNKSYYPGGSSSGAGSSLGAGLVPIAVGTDAGGSVRIPPAIAGQYALKTSHNRTCVKNSSMCIVGPMTSTVADLKIAYRTMAQPNPACPVSGLFAPSAGPDPKAKRYIGLCREWIARSTPAVLEQFNRALDHYTTALGYEPVDIHIPFLREGQVAHGATCLAESAGDARARVSPAADGPRRHWLDLLGPASKVLVCVGSQTPAADYFRFAQIRQVIMAHLAFLFERYPGLLVVSPMMPDAGYEIHPGDQAYGFSDGNRALRSMLYAWLSNTSGCPSVTAPAGYAQPEVGEGMLPVGMLAMGEWGEEERLLAWAEEGERYIHEVYPGGRLRPKGWVDVIGLAKGKDISTKGAGEDGGARRRHT